MFNTVETATIEYKREYSGTLIKSIIGFLNSSTGGHIYVGIEDADKLQQKNYKCYSG